MLGTVSLFRAQGIPWTWDRRACMEKLQRTPLTYKWMVNYHLTYPFLNVLMKIMILWHRYQWQQWPMLTYMKTWRYSSRAQLAHILNYCLGHWFLWTNRQTDKPTSQRSCMIAPKSKSQSYLSGVILYQWLTAFLLLGLKRIVRSLWVWKEKGVGQLQRESKADKRH